MPRCYMTLEEQLSDARSSEVAFRVKIENLGATPLELRSIVARIPEGATLEYIKDSSTLLASIRHQELCNEMTYILNSNILSESNDVKEAFSQLKSSESIEKAEEMDEYRFIVNDKADADIALKKWSSTFENSSYFSQLFMAKYDQLIKLESTMSSDQGSPVLVTIEPDSLFATTYVLSFPRTTFNPSKFSFSVDASMTESGSSKEVLRSVTTTVEISAKPYVLNCVAIICGLLGVAAKFSIENAASLPIDVFYVELKRTAYTGRGILAIIFSLVLFNIYEHIDSIVKVKMKVGWRAAMLIGVVSGLFNERIASALEALIGS